MRGDRVDNEDAAFPGRGVKETDRGVGLVSVFWIGQMPKSPQSFATSFNYVSYYYPYIQDFL